MTLWVVRLSVNFETYLGVHKFVEGTHTLNSPAQIVIYVIVHVAKLLGISTRVSVENDPR